MSHREREIVPDGRTSERKGALSLESFTSVRNTEDASVSRGVESVLWGVQFKEVKQIRRSSASDHIVANSSNLVFYSAFYRQPVQIHKKGDDMFPLGSLADKTSSTVHHTLNFVYEFLSSTSQQQYQPAGNYSNLNGTGQEM